MDPLATLFGLTAILLHLAGSSSRRPWVWRFGAAGAWLAALLCKEIAITVPVLAVCAELACAGAPRREAWRAWLRRFSPYGIALAVYLLVRWLALGGLLGAASSDVATAGRILHIPVVLGSYLAWLALPPAGIHLEPAMVGGMLALAAALLAATVALVTALLLRRVPEAALLAWCLVALLPVAQIRPLETELSERFLYLPSVGACLLAGALASRASRALGRAPAIAAACVVALTYATILVPRSMAWRDSVALWSAKAREEPSSLKAQLNLGRAFAGRGDVEGARRAYERAAELAPQLADTARAEFEALAGGGGEATEESIRRALESAPADGALWSNLGFTLLHKGDSSGALDAFTRAVTLVPARSNAWLGLSMSELRLGRFDRAIDAAQRCLALNPGTDFARLVLAESALRTGRPCDAIAYLDGISFQLPEEVAARDTIVALAGKGCGSKP